MRSIMFLLLMNLFAEAIANDTTRQVITQLQSGPNTGGLKLQPGFSANIIAPELGRNRHIAVNSNGDIYVKLQRLREGKGIVVLRENSQGKG